MTTPGPARAEHPEVPPPTGDAVPIVAEPDRAVAERTGPRDDADHADDADDADHADHARKAYADAERADTVENEAEAAHRHHG
jgi:hypothetical protein